jgi:hypothetical protein
VEEIPSVLQLELSDLLCSSHTRSIRSFLSFSVSCSCPSVAGSHVTWTKKSGNLLTVRFVCPVVGRTSGVVGDICWCKVVMRYSLRYGNKTATVRAVATHGASDMRNQNRNVPYWPTDEVC